MMTAGRSGRSQELGKVPVRNRAPTAEAAMDLPFDFDSHFDFLMAAKTSEVFSVMPKKTSEV